MTAQGGRGGSAWQLAGSHCCCISSARLTGVQQEVAAGGVLEVGPVLVLVLVLVLV